MRIISWTLRSGSEQVVCCPPVQFRCPPVQYFDALRSIFRCLLVHYSAVVFFCTLRSSVHYFTVYNKMFCRPPTFNIILRLSSSQIGNFAQVQC